MTPSFLQMFDIQNVFDASFLKSILHFNSIQLGMLIRFDKKSEPKDYHEGLKLKVLCCKSRNCQFFIDYLAIPIDQVSSIELD
jgi:hypothetical protein